MSTPNSFDEFLGDFRDTITSATTRLRNITPSDEVASDNWTPKEILGHLIDSAANNHQRFVRAQFTDDLVFSGYEQDRWVSVQKYREESWPELVQLWSSYNLHLLHLVSAIPEEIRTRTRASHNLDQIAWQTDKNKDATLDYFIRDYVDHLRHHLNQILEN
jgi:hypothetical protein